ncbi:MAG: TIGR02453 family protein [Planctomycetota bacterium]
MPDPLPAFAGFGRKTQAFLKELDTHNTRDWFNANKERYESEVVGPALAFISEMEPRLEHISHHLTAIPAKQGGSLMRIYRDVRFSKNKKPYKTNIAMHFRHELGKDVHAPGFYVHIQPPSVPNDYGMKGSMVGVGIWRPDAEALKAIRGRIIDKPDEWLAARDDADFKRVLDLTGDALKRPPRGFDPDHPCIEDLKRKDFTAMRSISVKEVGSAKFLDNVETAFAAAAPFMAFLCKAVGVRY